MQTKSSFSNAAILRNVANSDKPVRSRGDGTRGIPPPKGRSHPNFRYGAKPYHFSLSDSIPLSGRLRFIRLGGRHCSPSLLTNSPYSVSARYANGKTIRHIFSTYIVIVHTVVSKGRSARNGSSALGWAASGALLRGLVVPPARLLQTTGLRGKNTPPRHQPVWAIGRPVLHWPGDAGVAGAAGGPVALLGDLLGHRPGQRHGLA